MKFTAPDHTVEIEYDDNIWKAVENFQGSVVTFWASGGGEGGSTPTLSVFEYPKNSIPIGQVLKNTVEQISMILDDLRYEVLGQDGAEAEFTYEGFANGIKLKFYQRIEKRGGRIYSVTYGCDPVRYERHKKQFASLLDSITYEWQVG
ncbi:hypothetical protein EII22_01295 [Coriobacteriales bacterium OH1046]|nr:hypothetical protein EII22_01295 [Coriobacteriales bacterium OH1046]